MKIPSLKPYLIWNIKANLAVWTINAILFAIFVLLGSTATSLVSSGYFSKITLLETGIAFVIAGALAFSGSVLPSKAKEYALKTGEPWSMEKLKKSEKNANKYIVLAAILFLECVAISLSGF